VGEFLDGFVAPHHGAAQVSGEGDGDPTAAATAAAATARVVAIFAFNDDASSTPWPLTIGTFQRFAFSLLLSKASMESSPCDAALVVRSVCSCCSLYSGFRRQ
jgi:hypothetical protein